MNKLNIKIETINKNRWYMIPPDYSERDDEFMAATEMVNGEMFNTGIFPIMRDEIVYLLKAFGRVAGETVSYQIIYGELSVSPLY